MSVDLPVVISTGDWGDLKRSSDRSRKGLKATIGAPRRATSRSVVIMRGWLVPGLWPMAKMPAVWSKSSSDTEALPTPSTSARPTEVASWHMFEQSGKLLVP